MILSLKILLARIFIVYPKILRNKIVPYHFDYSKYRDSFISKSPPVLDAKLNKAPEIIYVFWTGNNELTENRSKGLDSIIRNSDVEVKLITPANLGEYVLDGYPLHRAYEYLSSVHKSDYLRCYFMYHYGGGYSDVKVCLNSWKMAFKKLNTSNKYALGYREIGSGRISTTDTSLDKYMAAHFFLSMGISSFIFKPRSAIAAEWISELHKRLDHYYDDLKKNPGDTYGRNTDYPIVWDGILGKIVFPLYFKYKKCIIINGSIRPVLQNYR